MSLQRLAEYERAVVFRFGRIIKETGPGKHLCFSTFTVVQSSGGEKHQMFCLSVFTSFRSFLCGTLHRFICACGH